VITTWDAVAGGLPAAHPLGRAVGCDLVWALAGGVWCSFAGIAGLLAGYALGTGAVHQPVRAPEIVTATWGTGPPAARRGAEADEDDERDRDRERDRRR
jgi:hypothetical protein